MRDLWRFAEAELLDGIDLREGRLTKLVLVAELTHERGTTTLHLDGQPRPDGSIAALPSNATAGLLAVALAEVLN